MLGIYGFSTLVLQYLAYFGLGLQYAINVELSTNSGSDDRSTIAAATTLTILIGSTISILGLGIQLLHIPAFEKYGFNHYAMLVGLIGGTTMVQQIYTNIYRVYGKLVEIAVTELFCALLLLILTCAFRGWMLIYALLTGWALSGLFAIVLFAARVPFGFSLSLEWARLNSMIALGIPLLVYNASLTVIAVIAQSTISIYYSVQTLGYYTLATSIASAVLLGFSSISWIAFPNILAKAHSLVPDAEAARITDKVNVLFGTGVFVTVFAGILAVPMFFWILPAYNHSREPLIALLLSEALLSSSLGYTCLAIARKKQMAVAKRSLCSVLFVTVSAVMIGMNHLPFVWVAIAVLGGSFLFTVLQARLGLKLISDSRQQMRSILPLGSIASVLLCLTGTLLYHPSLGVLCGALIFFVTNRSRIIELWRVCEPHLRPRVLPRATKYEKTL